MISISMPEIPDRDQEESLTDLLESIALEETALAHLINAEAEKLQAIVCLLKQDKVNLNEVLQMQKKVAKMLQTSIKKEILLQFKLESVLEFKERLEFEEDKGCYK